MFFLVYIREAHALDSARPMEFGMVEDPTTEAERNAVAGTCVDELDLPMPALVDGLDDRVGKAYGAWPDRLYLIGQDGRIAYAGARGPAGFDPDAWERAIEAELAELAAAKRAQEPAPVQKNR